MRTVDRSSLLSFSSLCREAVFKRLHVGTVSLALLSGNFVVQSAGMLQSIQQGGVTPIDSIVTAATTGRSFDRLSSAV